MHSSFSVGGRSPCASGGPVKADHPGPRDVSWAHRFPATPHRHWGGVLVQASAYRLPTVPCTLRACRPAYDRVCTPLPVCLRPRGARPPLPAPPVAAPRPGLDRNQLRRRVLDAFLAPRPIRRAPHPAAPCSPAACRGQPLAATRSALPSGQDAPPSPTRLAAAGLNTSAAAASSPSHGERRHAAVAHPAAPPPSARHSAECARLQYS